MSTSDSKSPRRFVADSVLEIPKSGIRDFFDIVKTMDDAISLGVGEPGFQTPWHIRDHAIYSLERGATGYTSNRGLAELREAIADYVEQTFRASYDPAEEILVTTGVSEGLDLAIRAITNPGDEILFHEPSYVSYLPVIRMALGTPVAIATGADTKFKLNHEMLAARRTSRTKALLLSYPNNPTGATLSRSELAGIADFAIQNDLLVISDEIYAELTYEDRHISIASFPGMKERTLLLHGFSKAWAMTGFRIGYCCGPPQLIEAMMTIHQYTMLCAPTLSQLAARESLKRPEVDVETMRSQYRLNRNYVCRAFEEMGLPCVLPSGAFYAFPQVKHLGMNSREFSLALLRQERTAVVPGDAFGRSGEGFIRCSFATDLNEIKIAMERIRRFVSRLAD